jgi:hypothetical protein
MRTILQTVTDFTEKRGLPTPSAVMGVTEKSVRQLRALIREIVRDLAEYRWQQQRIRFTWTALAAEDQGPLTTIFGAGYAGLVTNTLWNETRVMQILGPVTDAEWQQLQILPGAGPEYSAWISQGHLYINPAPAVTDTLAAVYITSYCVLDVDGVTTKAEPDADDDTLLFPDNVVARALEYKWGKIKGEAGWEDDYNAYIGLLSKNMVRDTTPVLQMDAQPPYPRPGIIIPPGSWNV